jgi:tetratricopeptide (TPR) repeat protein
MKEYLFEGTGPDGRGEKSSLVAVDVADAHQQLSRMGYRDIRILTGDLDLIQSPPARETAPPALLINAIYDSLPVAVLKIYGRNWLLWLPGVLLTAKAWWSEQSPYVGIALFVAGLLLTSVWSLPVVLHDQILWARVRGRYRLGLLYVFLLRHLNFNGALTTLYLDAERAKMLVGLGRVAEALQEFSVHADDPNRISYLTQLVAIHDSAGDRKTMIELQRQLLAESKNSNEIRIDLAWSLVRYTTQYEEARQLVAGIHASHCAGLYAAGLRIVHGLIAQVENQHGVAARELRKVHDELVPLSNPLTIGMRAELRAYLALSLKALGRPDEADALWQEVLPLLKIHHYESLIERYERAA